MADFDVVLCLGLLYHVCKPVELMERIAAANTDLLVIDTQINHAAGSYWLAHRESLDEERNSVDFELVFLPSRKAVCDLAEQFGYSVVPLAINMTSFRGLPEYLIGERLAFMCAKKTDLSHLKSAHRDPVLAYPDLAIRASLRTMSVAVTSLGLSARREIARLGQRRRHAVR